MAEQRAICAVARPSQMNRHTERELPEPEGPLKNPPKRFEKVLSVPEELQEELFRWQSEFSVCEHAACIGRALDVVTAIYEHFLEQFTSISDMRMRFMQAPTEYMVLPMYYSDRALDGLVHAISNIRNNINELFEQLRSVHENATQKYDAAEKMYQEVEMMARDDMGHFVEERKAKATVFRELSERIRSVRKGGSSMFQFLGKPWCSSSSICTKLLEAHEANPRRSNGQESQVEQGEVGNQRDVVQGEKEQCTPDDGLVRGVAQQGQDGEPNKGEGDVPETPEVRLKLNDEAPITQVSSPRPKNTSVRKRAREMRSRSIAQDEEGGVPVVRSLIPDASHAIDEMDVCIDKTDSGDAVLKSKPPINNVGKIAEAQNDEERPQKIPKTPHAEAK